MMLTRELFYAKTLVAQVKACKRFQGRYYTYWNMMETLNYAHRISIINLREFKAIEAMISCYLYE